MKELIGFWVAVLILSTTVAASAQMTPVQIAECDLDFDRVLRVTALDYRVFLAAFGKKVGEVGFDQHADRNNDDKVAADDWGLMLQECPLK